MQLNLGIRNSSSSAFVPEARFIRSLKLLTYPAVILSPASKHSRIVGNVLLVGKGWPARIATSSQEEKSMFRAIPVSAARLEHIPSGRNRPDGICLLQQASSVRAFPFRWNRARTIIACPVDQWRGSI